MFIKLTNLDVHLTWDDLRKLADKYLPRGISVYEIKSKESSVIIEGEATSPVSTPWSVCLEPLRTDDETSLVFHFKSIKVDGGLARTGLWFFKNLLRFDWSKDTEETLVEVCAKKMPGAWAEGKHLCIDLARCLSELTGSTVRIGTIKSFAANKGGLHFVIQSAK